MPIKGNLELDIDEQGVEVRITITPDPAGADITSESLQAILSEKKVRTGISADAIDKALRTLARKNADPVSFVAASGVPPQPATPETVAFEPCPIPDRLSAVARAGAGAGAAGARFPPARGKDQAGEKGPQEACLAIPAPPGGN